MGKYRPTWTEVAAAGDDEDGGMVVGGDGGGNDGQPGAEALRTSPGIAGRSGIF